jgi:hypothetical protein
VTIGQAFYYKDTAGGATLQNVPALGVTPRLFLIYGSNPSADTAVWFVLNQTGGSGGIRVAILVPAGGSFSYAPGNGGRDFSPGLQWGSSSDPDSYAASGVDLVVQAEGRILAEPP